MKNKKILSLTILISSLLLILTACANSKNTPTKIKKPTAAAILTKVQNTDFKNMNITWLQAGTAGKTMQKAAVKYQKKPTVIYTNFTTNTNHYKMWTNGKTNYLQMQAAANNKWFKTKLTKSSSYGQLTNNIAEAALIFFNKNANLFKVKRNQQNYLLTYQGTNKKLWNEIVEGSMINSIIGIDTNKAKPGQIKISIKTDNKYNLTSLKIIAAYRENKTPLLIKMNINQINRLSKLKIPDQVIKSSVDLESLSH